MNEIIMYKIPGYASIEQLIVKRDWMDQTFEKHAYHCFPVSLANTMGWGISYPEDISFIFDTKSNKVVVLSGEKYCTTQRQNATVSFKTGLFVSTNKNVSTLIMPVPNQFIDGAQSFTTLITSSFWNGEISPVWKITRPDTVITIKANQPVCSIIPFSVSNLNQSSVIIENIEKLPSAKYDEKEYAKKIQELNNRGIWSNFYRNGTDHKGNKIGEHEVKALRLKTVYNELRRKRGINND